MNQQTALLNERTAATSKRTATMSERIALMLSDPNHKMGEDDYKTKSGKGHNDDKGAFQEHVV